MNVKSATFIIPKSVTGKSELVVISKGVYDEFLRWKKFAEKRMIEEGIAGEAIRTYKREKKAGKLELLKSLADLD
ncbi:MAG: hypothetical protein GXP44_03105 [bacterium]|nr:hypothetical protein [bacterium]